MNQYKIKKNSLQETLIIPLYARWFCSQKFPGLFQDETAVELIKKVDYGFSALEKQSESIMHSFGALEVAMRQNDLAWEIRDYLHQHPKAAKNTGELPMYLIKNHHTPIIEPTVFDMVQVEMARRNSLKAMSDKCPTFKSKFSSKYALTGLVICGDCGGKYRRTTWSKKGKKKVVWRCISRLDYGTKYCSESVTIEEERLHSAIMEAINSLLDNAEKIKALMRGSISEILLGTNTMMQIHGLESSIKVKNSEIVEIIKQGVNNREDRSVIEEKCKNKHKEVSELQTRLNIAKAKGQIEEAGSGQLRAIYDTIDRISGKFTDYDEEIVRSMVTRVKILSKDQAEVTLFGTVTLKVSL